jgi:DNA-binding NtrC family response regulator
MSASPGLRRVLDSSGTLSGRSPAVGSTSDGRDRRAPVAVSFIGKHVSVVELLDLVSQVADTTATILITGESGTGKELIAQLIRERSSRRNKSFVAVNCGAIPESLQESEFFGHVRGAFTGATDRKVGKLELADGGTIFLDEIGEMCKSLQVALLRTLQSGEYSPVGSAETRYCDVRVLAAANRKLLDLVEAGEFRRDLYYRLNIIHLEVPPLREREGDALLLCQHFLEALGVDYQKPGLRLSVEARDLLLGYDYPGNVRELENIIRRAIILCRGDQIEPQHLAPEVRGAVHSPEQSDLDDFQSAKARAIETFERVYLTNILRKCGGIVSRASDYSGLSERNFHEKLKRYGISAKAFRSPGPPKGASED